MVFQNNSGNRGFVFTTNDGTNGINDPKMRLSGAGGFGNRYENPAAKLHIQGEDLGTTEGDQLVLSRTSLLTTNNTKLLTKARRFADGSAWNTSNFRIQKEVDSSPMGFIDFGIDGRDGNRGLGFGTNEETQLVIDATGNVGIGNTTPAFDVDILAPAASAADIALRQEDTGAALMLRTDNGGNSFVSNRNNFVANGSTNNNNLIINGQNELV